MSNFEIHEDGTICFFRIKALPGGGHITECFDLVDNDGNKIKAQLVTPEEESE